MPHEVPQVVDGPAAGRRTRVVEEGLDHPVQALDLLDDDLPELFVLGAVRILQDRQRPADGRQRVADLVG